jgi:hypothetical protein
MNELSSVSIYCINFNDNDRKSKMTSRFSNIGYNCIFIEPVLTSDPRIPVLLDEGIKRIWSIMTQHLDSIRHFYDNSENEYAIICEDDILISKNISKDLPEIIANFQYLELDILLMGYLLDKSIDHPEYSIIDTFSLNRAISTKYTYHNFPYHLWGSQMYMISRKHARFLLDKYTIEYGIADLTRPYNPDWTLTKDGKKAMIYPLIAVEEGSTKNDCYSQNEFHQRCFLQNYNKDIHF